MPLRRPHKLAPHIDGSPGQAVAQHPAADPVPRLDDQHAMSGPLQLPPCGQTSKTRTHHHHVSFGTTGHA